MAATLITEDYRNMQRELHRNPDYGVASVEYAPLVAKVMEATGIDEILDYGAGKGRLGETLRSMYENPLQPPGRTATRSAFFQRASRVPPRAVRRRRNPTPLRWRRPPRCGRR